jgi:hypothetical protein
MGTDGRPARRRWWLGVLTVKALAGPWSNLVCILGPSSQHSGLFTFGTNLKANKKWRFGAGTENDNAL